MTAMGFIGQKNDLGFEASGIVRSIGPGPHDQILHIGDRVSVVGPSMFRTSVVVKSTQCCKSPAKLSLQSVATVPCVYATAIYSLLTVGRLESGQVCFPLCLTVSGVCTAELTMRSPSWYIQHAAEWDWRQFKSAK